MEDEDLVGSMIVEMLMEGYVVKIEPPNRFSVTFLATVARPGDVGLKMMKGYGLSVTEAVNDAFGLFCERRDEEE